MGDVGADVVVAVGVVDHDCRVWGGGVSCVWLVMAGFAEGWGCV